jgi:hypothetical protein
VGFGVTGQLPVRFFLKSLDTWERWEYSERHTVHQLSIYFKKVYDSVMKEILCSVL